jgi:cell division protein FtsI (penicillin-binding protein 3)
MTIGAPTGSRVRPTVLRPLVANNVPRFNRRLLWTFALIALLFAALIARLAIIQVGSGNYYSKLSTQQVRTDIKVPSLRGGIFDRNGNILAISSPTSEVIADDFQISHPVAEAAALAPFVHVRASLLARELRRNSGYVILNANLGIAAGHRLSAQAFPGIVVLDSAQRTQPNGTIATSLIGGINAAGSGSAGLEYQYQHLLAGVAGAERVFASPSGVNLPNSRVSIIKKSTPGVGLELSIDTSLQFVVEQALGEQLRATGGVTGTAVVMDVKSGEILASASLVNTKVRAGVLGPFASWGQPIGVPGIEQTINNLAVSQVYEPGSVFKIVPFSASLDAGLISPTTHFSIPYATTVGGRVFHDAEHHGLLNLTATQILAQSSNIGTYEISRQVGEAGLLAQVERLGFGQVTALNYPGESAGLLVDAAHWHTSDLAALPIGQDDAVTPLQVLDAYNSIANDGIFVEPKLVRAYVSSNGTLRATAKSATHRALSVSVAQTLNQMLQQVVLQGTGTLALIPGYSVAGKTGTSQIPTPDHRSYIPGAYNASFVGFAPANNPVLSMIVIVQRPQTVIFGGSVAAPVFQRVMSYALHHYGIAANSSTVRITRNGTSIASDVT